MFFFLVLEKKSNTFWFTTQKKALALVHIPEKKSSNTRQLYGGVWQLGHKFAALFNPGNRFFLSAPLSTWTHICMLGVCNRWRAPSFRPICFSQLFSSNPVRLGRKKVGPKWIGRKVGLPTVEEGMRERKSSYCEKCIENSGTKMTITRKIRIGKIGNLIFLSIICIIICQNQPPLAVFFSWK